jgi:hypothetical protein
MVDYSRFDKIRDSDSDDEAVLSAVPAMSAEMAEAELKVCTHASALFLSPLCAYSARTCLFRLPERLYCMVADSKPHAHPRR